MGLIDEKVSLGEATVARIQDELRARGLDGWLLYDFQGVNAVASRLLGLSSPTSRRYLVLIPASGTPVALMHRIEQHPWDDWIGERLVYLGWRELEAGLAAMLRDVAHVAMEYSPAGAVPYVDQVPGGVVEMVRAAGVEVRSSAELVSAFYSRWTADGEASHRRAARAVQETAAAAFQRITEHMRSGEPLGEWELREWVRAELGRRGLTIGADSIVAVNAHAANPHYAPVAAASAPIRTGDLVLIDLWGKEAGEDAIYADQTWMGYVGDTVPGRVAEIWNVLREARDAAVALVREGVAAGNAVAGYQVDDAARAVVQRHGYGEFFIHRTGHSIDRELHGAGPNIDNLETRDTRELIRGIGFSIEPGIYIPGEIGLRTEINVYLGADGPEVTTPEPQREVWAVLKASA